MTYEILPGISMALRDRSHEELAMANTVLVLFDIDGTLSTGGRFTNSLVLAIEDVLKQGITKSDLEERVKLGRTPKQELMLIADDAGVPKGEQNEVVERILSSAATHFKAELSAEPLKAFDGAAELVEQLGRRDDTVLGIITNNPREIMRIKLDSIGLWERFSNGILTCGDDGSSKAELVGAAIIKAEKTLRANLGRENIFYFGDQVSDVLAGRLAGVVTIGVATGRSTFDELVSAGADVVLRNLSDVKAAMIPVHRAKTYIKNKQAV